jgi:N6-adenosine-specific RNA methylase IME4/ParB-like chromosome segregation protein Spo0J
MLSRAIREIAIGDITIPTKRMRQLRPETVDELAHSFGQSGQLQAIVVRPNSRGGHILVAGRHRVEAARKRGQKTIRAEIRDGLDADAALLAEIDENLVRADLSPAERALHVGRRKELYEKLHPETKRGGDRKSAKAKSNRQNGNLKRRFTKDAAKKTGKGERTIQRDASRAKITHLADVIGTSLDEGEQLDALAKLPETEQRGLIALAKTGKYVSAKRPAKLLRRRERERELANATKAASKALGRKLYGVIYADPPWGYDRTGFETGADDLYPTMTLDALKALKLPAADNCILFLWVPIPHLHNAMALLQAWGCAYETAFVWVKDAAWRERLRSWHVPGHWGHAEAELLLVAKRGQVPGPVLGEHQVVEARRGRHSEKPAVFAEMIERLFPNTPKLEMFARKARPGWDSHGNELPQQAA